MTFESRIHINFLLVSFIISILILSIFPVNATSNSNSNTDSKLTDMNTEVTDFENFENIPISSKLLRKDTIFLSFKYEQTKTFLKGETWDNIELMGGQYFVNPGQPMIPYKVHTYTSKSEVTDISVHFSNPEVISGIKIVPAPELYRIGMEDSSQSIDGMIIDNDYYSTIKFLPEIDYTWMKLGGRTVNNQQVWYYSIIIYSCKYNPGLGEAVLYQNSEIEITYEEPEAEEEDDNSHAEPKTRGSFATGPEEAEYVIVTVDYLMDEMQDLADWKTQKGVPAKVYDVQDIFDDPSYTGRDNEEKLRNFIKWSIENDGTKYVLFAGDYDKVPPRMLKDPNPYSGIDDGWISNDFYYACIDDGSTWDSDNDDTFGELGDIDDLIPDVAIARLAINDAVVMTAKIKEIIDYEKNPPDGNWFSRAALVGSNVFNSGDGEDQCKYLKNKYLNSVYDYYTELYDQDNSLTQESLKSSFNLGTSLMIYLGHGSSYVWTQELGYKTLMTYSDVNSLSNGVMKPVITTVSCDTSWFDAPKGNPYGDCIAEAYTEKVDKGAIGYLGSTRTTVGALTQSYYPYSPGLQEDFVRQINKNNLELGRAYVDGMAHYAQNWGHLFAGSSSGEEQACWMEQHLLGEPELSLWINKPLKFVVTNNTIGDKITVDVLDEQLDPVQNARICIWLENEFYDYKFTDNSGSVEFSIATNSDDLATLTVTKTGYLPYVSMVKLLDLIPPKTTYEISPEEPDGLNNWYITKPTINFSVDEDNSITYYSWDDEQTDYKFTETVEALEGVHQLHYYSADASGNNEKKRTIDIKVDTISPETGMDCEPAEPDGESGWYVSVPEITLEGEPDTTVYYHWDSYPFTIYENPINGLVGEHTLYYYARDSAGHIEPTNSLELKIDLDKPRTTIELEPELPDGEHNWYISKPIITLNVKEKNSYETYYYWDGEKERAQKYEELFVAELEGEHTIHYYTRDVAGNEEDLKWLNIKLDTITPETNISITPSSPTGDEKWYKGEAPIVTLSSSEENANIYYYWDSVSSRTIYTDPISAPEGVHILHYYSIDAAGNREGLHKVELKVDTMVPEVSYDIHSDYGMNEEGWYLEMPNIDLEMEDEGVIYYYLLEDGTSLSDYDESQLELMKQTYVAIYPPEGIYTYYFYGVDKAGNIGEQGQITIQMDLEKPVSKLSVDKYLITEGDWVIFNANKSSDENSIVSYQFHIGGDYISDWQTGAELNYTFKQPGTYEIFVKVKDPSGRISEPSQSVTITVKEKPIDAGSEFLGKMTQTPMILALAVVTIVLAILFTLFIRHRKSKTEWEMTEDDFLEDDDEPPVFDDRGMSVRITGSPSSRRMGGRRRKLGIPPPPPPKKLPPPPPPPPPSVVRIVPKDDVSEHLESDDVEWDPEETEDDEGIEWDDEPKEKKIKLECPKCDRRFSTTVSKFKSKNIKCPHCGAKGGL